MLQVILHPSYSRKVKISGLNISDPKAVLESWDKHYEKVLPVCLNSTRCRVVRYEQLVLRPKEQMKAILGKSTPFSLNDILLLEHNIKISQTRINYSFVSLYSIIQWHFKLASNRRKL